jgi:hypothetical protein
MKKIFTLLTIICFGSFAFGQTIFQSNFENWTGAIPDLPTDFALGGGLSNFDADSIVKVTTGAVYGSNAAELINGESGGERFTTQPVSVTSGVTYDIQYWVKGEGLIATRLWDGTFVGGVSYVTVNSGSWAMYSSQVTATATTASAEFMFYARLTNTTASNLQLDSVHVSVATGGPSYTKIYDIQYPANANGDSPLLGSTVTTRGVVTGIVRNGPARHSFFLQDSSKAYNGIYIYQLNDSSIVIGDSVEVTGNVDEFSFGSATLPTELTQIGFPSNITVLNSGNTLPTPVNISTSNVNMEEWEGVLVKVSNAECVSTTGGFGRWDLNDGSGVADADDDIFFYHLTAVVGSYYDVTGIGHYFFDEYSILPRDFSDISLVVGVNETTSANVLIYPNPVKDIINFKLDINNFNVSIIDVTGKTVKVVSSINNKLAISTSNLNNGIYFYSVYDNAGNTIATNKFIVVK